MKKQTFIEGAVILVVIGMIVKVLGLINRMIIARLLTTEGIGVYMLVMPTFLLIIALSTLGFPIAISKLVSVNTMTKEISNKTIVFKALKISLLNSAVLIALLLTGAKFLSGTLLKDPRTYYPILMLVFFIPLVSFTSILKGYLNGYKIIGIPSYSQLIEQLVRIVTSVTLVIVLLPYGVEYAVSGAVLSISFGEIGSLLYLVYKIKNKRSFAKILSYTDEKKDIHVARDILLISLPATGSRLIGSLSSFLEPIIFTFAMLKIGLSGNTVTEIYGQITGYTISLLLVPSFFCVAVSTPLIPIISEAYAKRNFVTISHYFNLSLFLSFLIGAIFSIVLTLYPKELMKLFFDTTDGTVFLSYMAPLFLIYYFQLPITSTLQSVNKASTAMVNTLTGAAIKIFLMYVLMINPAVNVHGLTIAIIVNSFFVTAADFIALRKTVKMHYNVSTIVISLSLVVMTYTAGLILKHIIPYSFISILLLFVFFFVVVYLFNIGNMRNIRSHFKGGQVQV